MEQGFAERPCLEVNFSAVWNQRTKEEVPLLLGPTRIMSQLNLLHHGRLGRLGHLGPQGHHEPHQEPHADRVPVAVETTLTMKLIKDLVEEVTVR